MFLLAGVISSDIRLVADSGDTFGNFINHVYGLSRGGDEADDKSILLNWPQPLTAVFAIGLLSAYMSTADTSLLLLTTMVQNELRRWNVWCNIDELPERVAPDSFTKRSLPLICGIGLFSGLLSFYKPDIVKVFELIIGLLSLVGIPALSVLLGARSTGLITLVLFLEVAMAMVFTFFISLNFALAPLVPLAPCVLLIFDPLLVRRRGKVAEID